MDDEHVGLSNNTYFLSYRENYRVHGGFILLDECPTRTIIVAEYHGSLVTLLSFEDEREYVKWQQTHVTDSDRLIDELPDFHLDGHPH